MIDMIAYVDRVPTAGETVRGREFGLGVGGKGSNQAAMAALLGARVDFVSCVGDDVFGEMATKGLREVGVEVEFLQRVLGHSSGVAPIWVECDGSNRIVIIPGANEYLDVEQVDRAFERLGHVDIVLCQLEVPQAAVRRAFERGREVGARTILNVAPVAPIDPGIMEVVDWVVLNRGEFAGLTGEVANGLPSGLPTQLVRFGRAGKKSIVVTCGEADSVLYHHDDDSLYTIPVETVEAVDTTGAGDAFVGAFAWALGSRVPVKVAAEFAGACATASVMRHGTQTSYPRGENLVQLRRHWLG